MKLPGLKTVGFLLVASGTCLCIISMGMMALLVVLAVFVQPPLRVLLPPALATLPGPLLFLAGWKIHRQLKGVDVRRGFEPLLPQTSATALETARTGMDGDAVDAAERRHEEAGS
ncbi:MAG TPA: hypothetical protein VIL86_16350 [Tepidisphaeraceae bacterium]|jgi:hypothetical protein